MIEDKSYGDRFQDDYKPCQKGFSEMKVIITGTQKKSEDFTFRIGEVGSYSNNRIVFSDGDIYHVSHFEFTVLEEKQEKESRTFDTGSKRDADETKPLVNHFDAYCRLRYGYLLRKGANHYGKNNWKLGQPDEAAIESLNRHLALYEVGDRTEDHLSSIIFNAQLLMKNEEKEGITFNHYSKL